MSSHSPPVSTPLEACRVAPYVNLPAMRSTAGQPGGGNGLSGGGGGSAAVAAAMHHHHQAFGGNGSAAAAAAAAAAAFSAFDPALLSAAHQVRNQNHVIYSIFVFFKFNP